MRAVSGNEVATPFEGLFRMISAFGTVNHKLFDRMHTSVTHPRHFSLRGFVFAQVDDKLVCCLNVFQTKGETCLHDEGHICDLRSVQPQVRQTAGPHGHVPEPPAKPKVVGPLRGPPKGLQVAGPLRTANAQPPLIGPKVFTGIALHRDRAATVPPKVLHCVMLYKESWHPKLA